MKQFSDSYMLPPAKDASAPDPLVEKAEKQAQKTSTSKGEAMFNWLTYGGIGFAVVFVATIFFGRWARYGDGKPQLEQAAKNLEKLKITPDTARDIVFSGVLGAPGAAAVIPIKIMENHKPELVDKFNNMLGDKSGDASVDKDSQQSWSSLIKGRLAAWGSVFIGFRGGAAMFGGDKFDEYERRVGEEICKRLNKPTHLPNMPKTAATETIHFQYGKIAALDVYATAAATTLLFLGSQFFAKANTRWRARALPIYNAPEVIKIMQGKPGEAHPSDPTSMPGYAADTAQSDTPGLSQSLMPRSTLHHKAMPTASYAETVASQKADASSMQLAK